ncbi:MAG: GTPase domain-containing protein [Candidatus Lokiarchaeota archaeon]|nr:GTPase domain-containing protein [Candidatus Lokiarchaeota archaeon]
MIINLLEKTLNMKIVYYGPALSGKTTSFKSLCDHFGLKNTILSIENSLGRTLFFDYGILTFQNESWTLKIHMYSTTGQDFYEVTRPITLKGVDGVFFVADSRRKAFERNLIFWSELRDSFKNAFENLPIILCFNKQDLPNKFPPILFSKEVEKSKIKNFDVIYTTASNGEGILRAFERMLELVFQNYLDNEFMRPGMINYAQS